MYFPDDNTYTSSEVKEMLDEIQNYITAKAFSLARYCYPDANYRVIKDSDIWTIVSEAKKKL